MRLRAEAVAAALALILLAGCAGGGGREKGGVKVGAPYRVGGRLYVPKDDRSYDRTGVASWYGREHAGKPTANGERFDPGRVSAAHPTLPMPSWVEVTVIGTGRSLVVRINDRGPFAEGRIIDLSHAAARKLGIDKSGTAKVRVRRVRGPKEARVVLAPADRHGYQSEQFVMTARAEGFHAI